MGKAVREVFVSRPTVIGTGFEAAYSGFERYMRRRGLACNRLGAGNYTLDAPLKGVISLMKQCVGAIVLGYPQYEFYASIAKGGVPEESVSVSIPTPWNQIEATLAFRQRIPVLLVPHGGVSGGVFDRGVTGGFVLQCDLIHAGWYRTEAFLGVFQRWLDKLK